MTGPLLLLLALLALARPALAELPDEPILRLEPGMHGALIRRIDVDAGERFLVTGADDKTVRVWSLADGRLLKTLRVPIGEGNVGNIYAVAISPDGERIAAGGWGPNSDGPNDHSIYILDRASARIVDRVDGLPNVINHLVFSPDGRHLVACLGRSGIRVYENLGFGEVAADADYGAASHSAAFDRERRLVTSSLDGKIRLYDPDFRLLETRKAPGGEQPFAVAFSLDGARIAVGYFDSTAVDVLDGQTLAPLFAADTTGVDNGHLTTVAWSADGQRLYAGGRYPLQGGTSVRSWAKAGRGEYEETSTSRSTISDLHPLAGGSLAFGTVDPALGVFGADGEILWRQDPAQADFRDLEDVLAVDKKGERIRFGFSLVPDAQFDLLGRRLTPDPEPDLALVVARTEAPGLQIEDWNHEYTPTLNGERLPLDQNEWSVSLAIAPDGERFLVGTLWSLRLFDRQGEQLWQKPAPGAAWAVNITGDGRLAVAAFGDGTIRWFRLEDGEELLAFFAHGDRERWVAWTPQGYYMASPGGEELIGWHVNQGLETPEFYSAGRFRDRFHRPDVVVLVLEEQDVGKALASANATAGVAAAPPPAEVKAGLVESLPPVIEIIDPASGASSASDFLTVTYLIRARGSVAPEISARIDGQVVKTQWLGGAPEGEVYDQISLPLAGRVSGGEFVVSLVAEDDHGASDPASVTLTWGGASAGRKKVALYVLAVGVSDYASEPPRDLDYAAKDADDLVGELLRQKERGLYRDVQVQALTDKDASLLGILGGLNWLRQQVGEGDVAIVFLAGHGIDEGLDYYFLPHSVEVRTGAQLGATGLGRSMLLAQLGAIYSKGAKVLAFIDTCYSGAQPEGARAGLPADVDKLASDLASAKNGIVVFTSSTGREVAYEDPKWQNGAFTEALLEALAGKASSGNRQLSISDLKRYLPDRVKELTDGKQTPQVYNETKLEIDAPIFVLR